MLDTTALEYYSRLHDITKKMKISAFAADWISFSALELESVKILATIENEVNIDKLVLAVKKSVIVEIEGILALQSEINTLARNWRESQSQHLKSEAMSAKLNNAYS